MTTRREPATQAPSASVDVEVRHGIASIHGLRAAWEELFATAGHEPSTSFEWTAAMCAHHVRLGDEVRVLIVRRGAAIIGLLPLRVRAVPLLGQDVKLLAPLCEEYNTHSDWLLSERAPSVVESIVGAIEALDVPWDCYRMSRLLEDNPLRSLLERALLRRTKPHLLRPGNPSYVLRLPQTYDEYLTSRSGKFRNYVKRVARKVGDVNIRVVTPGCGADVVEEAFNDVLAIERSSWKEAHGTSITAVHHQAGFYRDLSRTAHEAGRLHLQVLRIEGQPAAYNLGYLWRGQYWYLKTSFRDDQRHVSPATLLRAHLIADMIARGATTFDFPGDPYEWERQWTDQIRWHSALTVYAPTIRGRLLYAAERVWHRGRDRRFAHVDPRAALPPTN